MRMVDVMGFWHASNKWISHNKAGIGRDRGCEIKHEKVKRFKHYNETALLPYHLIVLPT